MNGELLAFSIFTTIAVVGSLMVVLRRNPVSSAFSLVLVFFAFAGLYAIMGAHLIAALQILVYTGAIMVLFVFVIMLLNQDTIDPDLSESGALFKGVVALSSAGLVYILVRTFLRAQNISPKGDLTPEKIEAGGGNLKMIAESIFNDHTFQLELTSFLILGATVATVALAKRKRTSRKGNL